MSGYNASGRAHANLERFLCRYQAVVNDSLSNKTPAEDLSFHMDTSLIIAYLVPASRGV